MNIASDLIKRFHETYNKHESDKIIEKRILENGLLKACVNEDFVASLDNTFNLELTPSIFHNQHNSYQCNIYAGIRVIKNNIADNLNMDFNKLNLSANYVSFFDKLEKVNEAYNRIAKIKTYDFKEVVNIVNFVISQGGTFNSFAKTIKKYGIVPTEFMTEVNKHYNPNIVFELLKDKVKADSIRLLEAKQNNANLQLIVEELLSEAYTFLSKTIGNPPLEFSYTYENKQGKTIKLNNIKPIEFVGKYLTLDLNKFIAVTSFELSDLKNTNSFIHNTYLENNEKIVTLESEKIKSSIINQLKNNMSVWFSGETSKTQNSDLGILSDDVYDFSILGIEKLSKQNLIKLESIDYDHAMVITGLNIENDGSISRFKVEDSRESKKDFYIMPANFFDNYVLTTILYEDFIL